MEASKNSTLRETLRFAVTGGLCFLVEFIVLVFLRDACGLDTLIAVPLAFLVSVIVNYLLCIGWVFRGAKEQGKAEKAGFLITSLMGLALNELLMFLFRLLLGEDTVLLTVFSFTATMYMLNKILSTLIVMVWNFFTKRAILKNGVPFFKKTRFHREENLKAKNKNLKNTKDRTKNVDNQYPT
ncbi:MAG: GtrA family protein [Clostridia bacterium]|nr:GtrA family protein [Clostridia bacterium]